MIKNQFYCQSKHWPRRIDKINKIFNKTIKLKNLGFKKKYNYFLNIILTNDREIMKLNYKYKNKKKPTDVLTFITKSKNKHYVNDTFCDIFLSGETLSSAKLAYKTYGSLNSDKSNVVLLPTFYNHFRFIFGTII